MVIDRIVPRPESIATPATVAPDMTEALGLDEIFAEMVLGLGLAILVGNGLAWYRHRRGEKPEGAQGEFRTGRVWFLLVVGMLMTAWGAASVFVG